MKNLNWFQARELGRVQRRAIRREGWQKWMLYRFYLWLVSENDSAGTETRRVVTALDFRDSEFLAKDWTDEPWEGATTPPCTTLPPATEIPVTPGAGTWTTTDRCGGDGEGGGVLPEIIDPGVPEVLALDAVIRALSLPEHTPMVGDGTMPDGSQCWITMPATYAPVLLMRLGPNVEPRGVFYGWFSNTGANLNVPVAPGESIPDAFKMGPQTHTPGRYAPEYEWSLDWGGYDGRFIIDPASGLTVPTPGVGATVTGRVDYVSPSGQRISKLVSYTFAPECSD